MVLGEDIRDKDRVVGSAKEIKGKIKKDSLTMNRNVLYLVIAALAVAAGVLGYQLYQENQKTSGVEINVDKSGISIKEK